MIPTSVTLTYSYQAPDTGWPPTLTTAGLLVPTLITISVTASGGGIVVLPFATVLGNDPDGVSRLSSSRHHTELLTQIASEAKASAAAMWASFTETQVPA